MKIRLLVLVLVLAMVSACAALDSGENDMGDGSPFIVSPLIGVDSQFAGDYSGKMTLNENTCENLDVVVGDKVELRVNVIQSGNLVSFGFVDETEASGILNDNNEADIIKRGVTSVEIYSVAFTEDGLINGTCEFIEGGNIADEDACAKYTIELAKE